jgi:hypothetical protein
MFFTFSAEEVNNIHEAHNKKQIRIEKPPNVSFPYLCTVRVESEFFESSKEHPLP